MNIRVVELNNELSWLRKSNNILTDFKVNVSFIFLLFSFNVQSLLSYLIRLYFRFLKVDSELRLREKEDQLENLNKKYEQLENLYNNDRSQLGSTLDDVARLRQLNSELNVGHKVFVILISLIQII